MPILPACDEGVRAGLKDLDAPAMPFWSDELVAIDEKRAKISQMRDFLDSKHKDHANADGHMSQDQRNEYLKKYEAELISPAEFALWKRGASSAAITAMKKTSMLSLAAGEF